MAATERPLLVGRRAARYLTELPIAGTDATLDRVFVATREGVVPSLLQVDLEGRATADGRPIRERLER